LEGIVRVRTGPLALATVVLAATLGCATSPTGRSSPPASPSAADHQTAKLAAANAAAQASPQQRRAEFEQLLGLHALLAVRLMRSVVAAAPDFVPVVSASLQWQGWETLGEARERDHDHDDTDHRPGK
jgi:hypothetical protein